jgi:hypothetical protein
MFLLRAFLALLALACIPPAFAQDQAPCAPPDVILQIIHDDYGEDPEIIGQTADGVMMVLTLNHETGSWTILEQRGALLCGVITGEHYKAMPAADEPSSPRGQDT